MIHPRLEADTILIKDLELCELRLLKDGDLDWFVLIPKREGVEEWTDLNMVEQHQLNLEINLCVGLLKENLPNMTKVNIGALGNIVRQFHLHIIARYEVDRAWPNAIWGTKMKNEFLPERAQFWMDKLNLS